MPSGLGAEPTEVDLPVAEQHADRKKTNFNRLQLRLDAATPVLAVGTDKKVSNSLPPLYFTTVLHKMSPGSLLLFESYKKQV